MKILFFIPRMGSGGSERVISVLANGLVKRGHEVHITQLIQSESFYPLDEQVTLSGLDIAIRRSSRLLACWDQGRFFLRGLCHIKRDIKTHQPDAVIAFMRQSCIMAWILKLLGEKTPLICSERNDPTVQGRFVRRLMKWVYGKADLFVCQGQGVYDYFDRIEKKCIISNPVPKYDYPCLPAAQRRKAVVAVGRLDRQKNFPLLIQSFGEVHKKFPDHILEIYGKGPEQARLEQMIVGMGAEDHIHLMGARSDLHDCIHHAAVFVMSSDYEGFPNALAEAMSLGLPVVSTDFATGIARTLIGRENGRVVPVGDGAALAEAMTELLSDPELRDVCSGSNLKISDIYSADAITEKWEQAIEDLIK